MTPQEQITEQVEAILLDVEEDLGRPLDDAERESVVDELLSDLSPVETAMAEKKNMYATFCECRNDVSMHRFSEEVRKFSETYDTLRRRHPRLLEGLNVDRQRAWRMFLRNELPEPS